MAAAKKGSPKPPSAMLSPAARDAVRWLAGPGRPLALLGLIGAVFFGGWYLVWRSVGPDLLRRKDYWLTLEDVEITPRPDWIRGTDVREEVFRDASLDRPLSILEDDLLERIRKAFSQNPWVARVVSVRKHHPARVQVELVYRRPVCMVEIGQEPPIPVDEEGVVLPGEGFSSAEARRYPRLGGIDTAPVGTRWGDPRVAAAAEIAAALLPVWEQLGLDRIVPTGGTESSGAQSHRFALLTPRQSWILWGRAPSSERSAEPSAAEKVARLEKYYREHGTLDLPGGRPNHLDLTQAEGIEVSPAAVSPPGTSG